MNNILKGYSSVCEDIFAYIVDSKAITSNKYFLDIGCNKFDWINNTKLLVENGWSGISIDYEDYYESYKNIKNIEFYQCDVTNKDTLTEILNKLKYTNIDYLSLDVDRYSLCALENIDLNKFIFKIITIEHDSYQNGNVLKDGERKILESYGYIRVVELYDHEDWWIYPKYFDNLKDFEILKNINTIHRPFDNHKINEINKILYQFID